MKNFYIAFLVAVSLALFAEGAKYSFQMNYKLTNAAKYKNAYIGGVVSYKYDEDQATSMRVHYKHTLSTNIIELENYDRKKLYKKCGTTCEVFDLQRPAEPWYILGSDSKGATGSDGYTKYTRSPKNAYGIIALWVKANTPSAGYLSKLQFKDGTILEFTPSSYSAVSFTDSRFNDNAGASCVTDKCDPYIDLVFVFDESGSIKDAEFETMKKFAKNVTKQFTLGKSAAAVALVTYAGNIDYKESGCKAVSGTWKKFTDNGGKSYYYRCNKNQKNTTSSKRIRKEVFQLTWGSNVNTLIGSADQIKGNTCQGYGLLSAWEMMKKKNPRVKAGMARPYSVAIGLTDGADACPNLTEKRAKLIKNDLGGIVIEVGVGLDTNYDKDFLKRVASTLPGDTSPAYFNAKNFNDLANKVKGIATKICESTYSSKTTCNSKCTGYCGCKSTCYCPTCSPTGTKCVTRACSVSSGTTAGCVDTNVNCNQNNKCYTYSCDASAGCQSKAKDCTVGLKTCQVASCTASGGCSSNNYDSKCPAKPCMQAKCSPGASGADPVTGCVYTNTCVGPSPTTSGGCIKYTCNNGKCETTDTCVAQNTLCTKYKCNTNTNKCVVASNVTCTDAPCEHGTHCDLSSGRCVGSPKDNAYCTQVIKKNHPTYNLDCAKTFCDANHNGDEHCVVTGLGSDCSVCGKEGQESNDKCQAKANTRSQNEGYKKCYHGVCVGVTNSSGSYSSCNITSSDCVTENACQDPICTVDGVCTPKDRNTVVGNKCYSVVCNSKTRSYELVYVGCGRPNARCQKETCDNETGICTYEKLYEEHNCTESHCDPETGMVSYTPRTCPGENRCKSGYCDPKTNQCATQTLDSDVACRNSNKCIIASCDSNTGKCSFKPATPPGTDVCKNYTCDPATGNWTVVDKCDDGLICTTDQCDYEGNCWYEPRECSLNMTGFDDCFISACSEKRKNGCYRKVVDNAYFDECGVCLGSYEQGNDDPNKGKGGACKEPNNLVVSIAAGAVAAIVIGCVLAGLGVSIAGTLLTRELIRRAKAAADSGAVSNPMYEDSGREMSNPAFEGNEA